MKKTGLKRERFIELQERGDLKRLMQIFQCTDVTIYAALKYDSNTERAKRIRALALKSRADGGCEAIEYARVER